MSPFIENQNLVLLLIVILTFLFMLGLRWMLPKRIYFVRHGETILNAAHIRQDATGSLSEIGKEQARSTGLRLSKMHIEHLYISPYERTVQTAAIINEHLHVPFTCTDLLAERRNPSEIIGKKYDDLAVEKIINEIDLTGHDASFRYSDEENFEDLQKRAEKLLSYLAFRPHRTIVCITHGIFLKMILAHIARGKTLTPLILATLTYFTKVHNAGITLVTYSPWQALWGKKAWDVIVFDDISKVH